MEFLEVGTNAYFVADYRSSTKKFFKTYILGYNIDITTVPSPQYTDESYVRCLKLSSGKTQTRIRSGYNANNTNVLVSFLSPSVSSWSWENSCKTNRRKKSIGKCRVN